MKIAAKVRKKMHICKQNCGKFTFDAILKANRLFPADFTQQDAVKQAEVLGVSVRTMEKWIDKLVQSTDIVRVTHGQYQKRECKIA